MTNLCLAAKKETGLSCSVDSDCKSDFCMDGTVSGEESCQPKPNTCKCTDGTAAGIWFGTTCETDGAEDCKNCNIGYILKDQVCEAAPTPPPTPAPPAKKEIGQSCSEDSEF